MKKTAAVLALALASLLLLCFAAGAENSLSVEIDGNIIEYADASPYISGGTAMIPVRFTVEEMGCEFNWYPAKNQAEVILGDFKAVMTVGSKSVKYTLGGESGTFKLENAVALENDRMLCSRDGIEFFAENAGYNVLSGYVDSSLVITSASAAKAVVAGKVVSYSGCAPAIVNGAAMFPVRFVAEAMDLSFYWYPSQGKAVISDGKAGVDFVINQKIIKFGSATFTADRNIILCGNQMYASAPTLKRMAEYFGAEASVEGCNLNIRTPDILTVKVNGENVAFRENSPTEIDGALMLPLETLSAAMGLEYHFIEDDDMVNLSDPVSGRHISIGVEESYIDADRNITGTDSPAKIKNGIFYVTPQTLIAIAEATGGAGSYNRYGSGLIISVNQPYTVKVNGTIVVFPDIQPEAGEAVFIPVRFAVQSMGLDYLWHAEEKRADIISAADSGKYITLELNSQRLTEFDNGKEKKSVTLNGEIFLRGDRLLVSADAMADIADFFGMDAVYGDKIMEINSPDFKAPAPDGNPADEKRDAEEITVTIDGEAVVFPDVKPLIADGRTLIPVRAVAENMKMEVLWDGEKQLVTVKNGGDSLELAIDGKKILGSKDGETTESELDVPAVIIGDRTCVPIRAVVEFFGGKIDWDGETKTVSIISPKEKLPVKEIESKEVFGEELGFVIDASIGAADVSYALVGGNTAQVTYRIENTVYTLRGSCLENNAVMEDIAFSGPKLNYKTDAGKEKITISAGNTADGNAAQWEIGQYNFSLKTSNEVQKSEFFYEAANVAQTFAIIKETAPSEDKDVVLNSDPSLREVKSEDDFEILGFTMKAPSFVESARYGILDESIAQISFIMNGFEYVLRGAQTTADISGIKEEYSEGIDIYVADGGEEMSTIIARKTLSGARAATWRWGRFSFCLTTKNEFITDAEFGSICSECGKLSYQRK